MHEGALCQAEEEEEEQAAPGARIDPGAAGLVAAVLRGGMVHEVSCVRMQDKAVPGA